MTDPLQDPGVQGLAQLGRNAIERVAQLEEELATAFAAMRDQRESMTKHANELYAAIMQISDERDRLRAELAGYVEANRCMKGELDDALEDARRYCEAKREIARLREALESASSFAVGQDIRVDKCWQRDGSFLWAVRKFGNVLANDGAGWNYETIPSERDEAFMARYRFATMELAMTAARAALAQVAEVSE